jgi:hypothetical protein
MKQMKDSRKTQYTKMVLRDSLMELLQKKPISKITIKELCEEADINRTTFYTHFLNQYDLLKKIEDETLVLANEIINDLQNKSDRSEILPFIEGTLETIAQNKYIGVLMSERGDISFQNRLCSTMYSHPGMQKFIYTDGNKNNDEWYKTYVIFGMVGVIRHWLKNNMNISYNELAEILFNIIFHGKQC